MGSVLQHSPACVCISADQSAASNLRDELCISKALCNYAHFGVGALIKSSSITQGSSKISTQLPLPFLRIRLVKYFRHVPVAVIRKQEVSQSVSRVPALVLKHILFSYPFNKDYTVCTLSPIFSSLKCLWRDCFAPTFQ